MAVLHHLRRGIHLKDLHILQLVGLIHSSYQEDFSRLLRIFLHHDVRAL